jgi:hypothetical protein
MIPLEKEIQIHKMLLAGSPQKEVAARAEVSASTVARIVRSNKLADEISERDRRRARMYLISGLTPEAVASHLDISIEAVWAIQRSELLLASVVETPHPCPTCGSVMLPADTEFEHYTTPPPRYIPCKHARVLFALADEVVGLSKAYAVRNMLFYDIADRMEVLLSTIIREDVEEDAAEEPTC